MYHNVSIIGHLGRDPEMRYTPEGQAVTSFSMAVSRGKDRTALWFKVNAWEKQAEACNTFLHKGSKVFVIGVLLGDATGNPRIWQRQDGTAAASFEVNANRVIFLSGKEETPATDGPAGETGADPQPAGVEDEIPF